MIIEYANYGSLKDFLKLCEEAVLRLNHIPQVQMFRSRTSSASTNSSSYPHLVCKIPLSNQNSVFSSNGTPTTLVTAVNSSKFDFSSPLNLARERLVTQDSGFFGDNVDTSPQAAYIEVLDGGSTAHSVVPLTHDYTNSKGLLYMEDIQNFALQIASGLKHLEDIQVGPVRCS